MAAKKRASTRGLTHAAQYKKLRAQGIKHNDAKKIASGIVRNAKAHAATVQFAAQATFGSPRAHAQQGVGFGGPTSKPRTRMTGKKRK